MAIPMSARSAAARPGSRLKRQPWPRVRRPTTSPGSRAPGGLRRRGGIGSDPTGPDGVRLEAANATALTNSVMFDQYTEWSKAVLARFLMR